MKTKTTLTVVMLLFFAFNGISQIIWTGSPVTFTKVDGADWTLQANQDRITSKVWITRKSSSGLFNIFSEASHDKPVSPADTEWAFGTTADIATLAFKPWRENHGEDPPSQINQDMVLHLISEHIYIDIMFLSWSSGGSGGQGGFSYIRSTDQTIGINEIRKQQLAIYPNPAKEYIIIKDIAADSKAEIFDISGKKILELHISMDNHIDISGLDKGIYFLMIQNQGFTKFIKE